MAGADGVEKLEDAIADDLRPYYGLSRHIVMPFIPRNADNVGIV